MKSPIIAAGSHPHHQFTNILQLGLKSVNLALVHKTVLEPRLQEDTIEGLTEDLDSLGVVVPGAMQAREEAKVATLEQSVAARRGYTRIQGVRKAARKSDASKDVKKAYGVGQTVKPKTVRDVKSALKQIIDRATANPDEAAKIGIVKKDLDAMIAAHDALKDADKTQENKRATAPLTTRERNRTANRILKASGRISAAGILEFAEEIEVRKEFEALKPPARSKKSPAAPAKGKGKASAKGKKEQVSKAP